jgi:hypothetical protein
MSVKDFIRDKLHGRNDRIHFPFHFSRGDIVNLKDGRMFVLRRDGSFRDQAALTAALNDRQQAVPLRPDQIDRTGWYVRPTPDVVW